MPSWNLSMRQKTPLVERQKVRSDAFAQYKGLKPSAFNLGLSKTRFMEKAAKKRSSMTSQGASHFSEL